MLTNSTLETTGWFSEHLKKLLGFRQMEWSLKVYTSNTHVGFKVVPGRVFFNLCRIPLDKPAPAAFHAAWKSKW